MPSFLSPLLQGNRNFRVVNERTGAVLAEALEPAFDSPSRNRGLLGRDSLAPSSVLVLAPCNSIHTFFMRFPIDVAFVAKDGRVLKIRHGVRPWRIAWCVRAFCVLEFAAGTLALGETTLGDRLLLHPKF